MEKENLYVIKDDAITKFRGEFAFLSNMYSYKSDVSYNGLTFNSVEAAYHGQKDPSLAPSFSALKNPVFAKKKGSGIKNIRSDWDLVKDGIMEELVRIKFTSNERLKDKLLDTGDRQIVEGNDFHDYHWGVDGGFGLNRLGEILMKIRSELRNGRADV